MKKRIWELDALRGLCVLGMVIIHLIYNLNEMYRIVHWQLPKLFTFLQNWGGVLFLLISGISITLGKHHIKRGLLVCAAGLLISLVTYGMTFFGFSKSVVIYFGVLHCLGICMLLWAVFRHFPRWALLVTGLILTAAGLWIDTLPTVEATWLFPLGFISPTFASADYFPLLPNLGYFLVGAFLGRTVYAHKASLLPRFPAEAWPIRFLSFCGRQSLWIYLLHQPVLSGICFLLM